MQADETVLSLETAASRGSASPMKQGMPSSRLVRAAVVSHRCSLGCGAAMLRSVRDIGRRTDPDC
jgi:hypothetical protein